MSDLNPTLLQALEVGYLREGFVLQCDDLFGKDDLRSPPVNIRGILPEPLVALSVLYPVMV